MRHFLNAVLLIVIGLHLESCNHFRTSDGGVINIGSRRECFFDTVLLDGRRTNAGLKLHHPIFRGAVLRHDAPWEGAGSNYHNFFFDESWHGVDGKNPRGTYRMYYLGWQTPSGQTPKIRSHPIVACYAESADGIHWVKPVLGRPFMDVRETNIVLDANNHTGPIDNFMVFRDDNPECPPSEHYKGVAKSNQTLRVYTSADGLHFTEGPIITDKGIFDSLNVFFYDPLAKIYRGYIRDFHQFGNPSVKCQKITEDSVRDIRLIESKDFKTWSDPRQIVFDDNEDIPLYTNVISQYFRAPHLYIGFPSRYIERPGWNGSFEELGGKEMRQKRMKFHPRYGLTVTDCIFIVSRDGFHFHRFGEAFMRPEMENNVNWVYGDCFPARGFAVTPNPIPGCPDELSFYLPDNHWMDEPANLNRYSIRMDGFASLNAGRREVIATTKQIVYTGTELRINFETSARGYVYITLVNADGRRYTSCETFGNALDRKVIFDDPAAVAANSGKPVTLEFRMRDADVYSMQFR